MVLGKMNSELQATTARFWWKIDYVEKSLSKAIWDAVAAAHSQADSRFS
jgi:hypothetical protein